MAIIDWVLVYAGRGWLTFPIIGGGKLPLLPSAHPDNPQLQRSCKGRCGRDGHGLHDATVDPDRLRAWWQRDPAANVGVRTGPESNLLVVDIDADHDGFASVAKLEHGHDRGLSTLEAATGGGGAHLLFRYPQGVEIRNSAGKLGRGVDVRATAGFIVAPPSLHRSGERYRWCTAYTEPQDPPDWLVEQLAKPTPPPEPPRRRRRTPPPFAGRARGGGYVARALEGEQQQLLTIPEGRRHDELVKSATRIGGLLHLVAEAEAEAIGEALVQTGQDMGLPEAEARAVVDDQLAYGRQHPRRPA